MKYLFLPLISVGFLFPAILTKSLLNSLPGFNNPERNILTDESGAESKAHHFQSPPEPSTWIWPANIIPVPGNGEDGVPLNLGLRFRSSSNGFIQSIRFWKRPGNNGTHIGTLWTNTGTKLAEVTFTNETASGWQTATFATPVPVTANTTYVASYFCPLGQYSKEPNYFNPSGGTGTYSANPPLSAPADGLYGGNGLYTYNSGVSFPAQSAASSNYWVDVQFNAAGGTVTNQPPVINAAAGPVITLPVNTASLTATATDSDGTIASYAWSKLSGPAGGTIATPATPNTNITGLNSGIYVYRLTVRDNLGAVTTADVTVTVNAASTTQTTWIWPASLTPASGNGEDGVPLNLGLRFRSSSNGFIQSIRFWKRPGNNGTHIGTLWTNTGTKLAEVTFTNETASGWQTATFATPVPVTANTTYVASYFCPLGQYSKEPNYFNPSGGTGTYSANPPLSAPADGLYGGNGLYAYNSGVSFPAQSAASSNYWVDVQFNAAGGMYTGNLPPIVDAGLDQTITLPVTSVILTGSATDPDGTISNYSWIKVSGPAGEIISTPNQASTRVSNLVEGTYVFSLTAADNRTAADTGQVTIRVLPAVLSPVSFSAIPFSEPDIVAPFRGAEDWHYSNSNQRISHPTESQHAVPQDVYYRSFLSWDKLESSQGNYNWTYLNQLFNDAISKRQKISFGIMSQVPGQQNATIVNGVNIAYPVYLHNLMQADAPDRRDYISPYENMWVPNYNSEYYLSRFEALLNALATHINNTSYNGIPYKDALGYVDIRGYGSWGEWNMVGVANRAEDFPAGRRPLAGSLIRIVDAHKNAFPNNPLISLLAAYDGSRFSNILIPPAVGYHILTTSNTWGKIGWRMDSYGWSDAFVRALAEENTTVYNGMRFDTAIMNRYRYAPIGGEGGCGLTVNGGPHPFWYVPRQVRTYHTSLLGNGNFCGENLGSLAGRDSMRLAWKLTGYRIVVESGTISSIIQKGSPLSISLNWKNTGLAPVYENWNVYYELQNQSTNAVVWSGLSAHKLKLWQPSASATIVADNYILPATIPNGTYRLVLKIKDPLNYRAPLPLALTNRRPDGSYTLRENITLSSTTSTSMISQNRVTDEKTTLVSEDDEKFKWSVYPVPVKRGTPLFIAGHSGKTYTIRLLNSGGGVVLKKTANGPVQLETANFRTGLYFMQLTDHSGQTVKRIIIME